MRMTTQTEHSNVPMVGQPSGKGKKRGLAYWVGQVGKAFTGQLTDAFNPYEREKVSEQARKERGKEKRELRERMERVGHVREVTKKTTTRLKELLDKRNAL